MGMLDAVRRESRDAWNKYIENRVESWEGLYAQGYAGMLDEPRQRARHYVIAGLLGDLAPRGASILDIGCGGGTTYRLLRGSRPAYVGVDLSENAIQHCRERYGRDPSCSFEVSSFERFAPERRFEVVLLNEVLYYFPATRARAMVEKAISHLAGPESLLVISMSNRAKGRLLWALLHSLPPPLQRISVQRSAVAIFGGEWTVKAYSGLRG